jgi:hypothetical protein
LYVATLTKMGFADPVPSWARNSGGTVTVIDVVVAGCHAERKTWWVMPPSEPAMTPTFVARPCPVQLTRMACCPAGTAVTVSARG